MPSALAVLAAGVLVHSGLGLQRSGVFATKLPSAAQVIDQKSFNVLDEVLPPVLANDSTVCYFQLHPLVLGWQCLLPSSSSFGQV